MLRVTSSILGTKQIDFGIVGLQARLNDIRPIMPAMIDKFHEYEKKLFDSEGGSGRHGKWAKLAPSTQKDRERKGFGARGPILHRKLHLRRSLVGKSRGSLIDTSHPMRLVIGTRVHYAIYHQKGYRIHAKHGRSRRGTSGKIRVIRNAPSTRMVPARRPVDITPQQQFMIAKQIHVYMQKDVFKKFGFKTATAIRKELQ